MQKSCGELFGNRRAYAFGPAGDDGGLACKFFGVVCAHNYISPFLV
jgi:hypothetical protein